MTNTQLILLVLTILGTQLAAVYFTVTLLLGEIHRSHDDLATKMDRIEDRLYRHLEDHLGKEGV